MDRRKLLKTMTYALGATIATPTLMSLLSSCNTNTKTAWTPLFLATKEALVLKKISHIILPIQSESIANVEIPKFIDLVLNDVISPSEQDLFLKGAIAFKNTFERTYNTSILKENTKDIETLISSYFSTSEIKKHPSKQQNATNKEQQIYDYLFFIRKYTIWGYATSKASKIG